MSAAVERVPLGQDELRCDAGLVPRLELRIERSEPADYICVSKRQSTRLVDVIVVGCSVPHDATARTAAASQS